MAKVLRTATGPNSEQLDCTAWNLEDLVGRSAQIAGPPTPATGPLLARRT